MILGEGAHSLELAGVAASAHGEGGVADDDDVVRVRGAVPVGLEVVAAGEERGAVLPEWGEHGPNTAEVVLHGGERTDINIFWRSLRNRRCGQGQSVQGGV